MKLAIIITNDWELYGNGKGDYFKIQKEPLQSLIEICSKYGAKLTIFAEVLQQLNDINNCNKEVSEDWEKTVVDLVSKSHDVQLHLHPQLLGDYMRNPSMWSIANLESEEMLDVITSSKYYLETLIRNNTKDYKCIAFRAGGYAIQPSKTVLKNLYKAGIKCETSVTKGLSGVFYSFKDAYSHFFPWYCSSDIQTKNESENSLLEMPIFSIAKLDSPLIRKLFPKIYYPLFHNSVLTNDDYAWLKNKKKKGANYSFKDRIRARRESSILKLIMSKLIQTDSLQFDYDNIPAKIMVKHIKRKWEKIVVSQQDSGGRFDDCYIPIVLIGHTKNLYDTYNIEHFFQLLEEEFKNNFEYLTISDFYNSYQLNFEKYKALDEILGKSNLH